MVLDGSATLGFLLDDERSIVALHAFDALQEGAITFVPTHRWLETTNGLIMAGRRKRVPQSQIMLALQLFQSLPVITDGETSARCAGDTVALARQYGLTVYDAAYLELALRRGSALATVDELLVKAARATGVALLE